MIRAVAISLVLAAAWAPAQTQRSIDDLLRQSGDGEATDSKRSTTPSLEDVFMDIGRLIRSADGQDVMTLQARLKETEDELRLLENLRSHLKRGILVELPAELRRKDVESVSPEMLEQAKQALEALKTEIRVRKIKKQRAEEARRRRDRGKASGTSGFGAAVLAVRVEVPEPPMSETATSTAVSEAVDPGGLGKARYLAGDFVGALNAFSAIPEGKRSFEVRYRLARAQEKLDRWSEAKKAFEALAKDDAAGFWGKQAKWMLRFGGHKQAVRDVIGKGKVGK